LDAESLPVLTVLTLAASETLEEEAREATVAARGALAPRAVDVAAWEGEWAGDGPCRSG
jgi:hypothetical protein